MSKFWALITSNRPKVYSLGQHDDFDKAAAFATGFCERKNEEIQKLLEKARAEAPQGTEIEPPEPYELIWIMDDDDMRMLTGTIHRPYVIAREKRDVVGVDLPVRHGGSEPVEQQEAVDNVEVS